MGETLQKKLNFWMTSPFKLKKAGLIWEVLYLKYPSIGTHN